MTEALKLSLEVSRPFSLRGFATGDYLCRCMTCEGQFVGDKRALSCLPCAVDQAEAARSEGHAPERPMGEVVELYTATALIVSGLRHEPLPTDKPVTWRRWVEALAKTAKIIALTAPGGGGEGKDMASQGSAAAIRGPYPVLPANASNTGKEGA